MWDKDDILIKKAKKGDIDAFEKLILKHQKKVYNIALKMLKNPEDAMDVSQEALIKVFKSLKGFKNKSSFSTWIYRIVVNTCLDFIKKKKNTISLDKAITTDEGEIQREVADNNYNPEYIYEKKLSKELVNNAIEELSDNHKSVIVLRDIEGFSYEEISKIINCSLGTVKSRIKRARENLRIIITKNMEQNENKFV